MNFANNIIYQVDAFTDEKFKGNPAAVMIMDSFPDETHMQNIAMEMNLSETAFVVPQNGSYRIRYFTPKAEIQIAGHPTLASAHILYEEGFVPVTEEILFESNVASLYVKKDNNFIVMSFPQFKLESIEPIAAFKNIIGFQPEEMFQSEYGWKIAVSSNIEDIVNATPNFPKMSQYGLGHLMITAKSASNQEDFVVRCFAPDLGVDEDPVTGSAHCALAPLWASKLGETKLKSRQISKRSGEMWLNLNEGIVEIKGSAITVFEAKFR